MHSIKRIIAGLSVLLLIVSFFTVTAFAHNGEHLEPHEHERKNQSLNKNEDDLKHRGAQLLEDARKKHKTQAIEQRKANCQTRKQGLERKIDNLASNGAKHQKRIDEVFSKITAYVESSNVAVNNYETLLATATAAQGTAQVSVKSLENLKPTIDCNSETVASDVATFKAAAADARADLSAYKKAVRAILTAVREAGQGGAQ